MTSGLFDVIFPVFALIACGFGAGRLGWMNSAHSDGLNRLVYYLAFPALLFIVIARTPRAEIVQGGFLLAWTASVLVGYLLTCLLSLIARRDGWGAMGVRSMNTTCGNTAMIGIPLCVAAFGQDAALPAVLATTVLAVLNLSLTLFFLEAERQRGGAGRAVALKIARALAVNPLLIAVVCGIVYALLLGAPPPAMDRLFQTLGTAAIPCSLVAVGIFISGQRRWWAASGMLPFAALKLAAMPLVAWVLATQLFQLDARTTAVLVVLSAMPPASTGFVIAQRYGTLVDESASMLVFSTIVSVVTLAVLLAWVQA